MRYVIADASYHAVPRRCRIEAGVPHRLPQVVPSRAWWPREQKHERDWHVLCATVRQRGSASHVHELPASLPALTRRSDTLNARSSGFISWNETISREACRSLAQSSQAKPSEVWVSSSGWPHLVKGKPCAADTGDAPPTPREVGAGTILPAPAGPTGPLPLGRPEPELAASLFIPRRLDLLQQCCGPESRASRDPKIVASPLPP